MHNVQPIGSSLMYQDLEWIVSDIDWQQDMYEIERYDSRQIKLWVKMSWTESIKSYKEKKALRDDPPPTPTNEPWRPKQHACDCGQVYTSGKGSKNGHYDWCKSKNNGRNGGYLW